MYRRGIETQNTEGNKRDKTVVYRFYYKALFLSKTQRHMIISLSSMKQPISGANPCLDFSNFESINLLASFRFHQCTACEEPEEG